MSLIPGFLRRLAGTSERAADAPPPQREPSPVPAAPAAPPRPAVPEAQIAAILATALKGPATQFKRFPQLPGSDEKVLAEAGRAVCGRLDRLPQAWKVAAINLDMYTVRNFLSPEECAALTAMIDADVKPSTLLTGGANTNLRTSQTCRLSSDEPLVAEVEQRMVELLGLPLAHSETVQGQRYAVGQQFRMHNDYFAGGQAYSEAVASEGGQRTWTAMVFLNRPDAGGCTNFPRAMVKVEPEPGTLLTWNNNDREGLSNPFSHHEGMPVEAGTKYILTKWFREREWHSSAASDALRV
jgi:prolyl 4-hydroxylase